MGARNNGSRPITSRQRRSKAEMEVLRGAISELLYEDNPMTVRQVYYRLVTTGAIEKTEQEYKGTVVRLLTEMRRAGDLPFEWIADNTRWMRKPRTHSSLHDMLASSARTYRRSIWQDQSDYVEVWLEKEALAGVLYHETERWDVPLMVTRGYPSLSFIHGAAESINACAKPTYLYYFGDHDPSGLDITRSVEEGIRELAPDAEIYFERVAVTREQIDEYDLPTRPTKKTDARSRHFAGESVEVDAIPPADLRALVSDCIERHIAVRTLDQTKAIEQLERETLDQFASNLPPIRAC